MPIPFSFIHAADLHLGSAFKGLHQSNAEVADVLRAATYRAFERILDYAIEKQVDFVLFAGDIYDRNENSLQPQLKFRDGLSKLHEAGIRSCVVHGNHDPFEPGAHGLNWPESCHRFIATAGEPCVMHRNGEEIAVVCGISYAKRTVTESLARSYRHQHSHLFTIGLLHTNCGGNAAHGNYAPSSVEELRGYDFNYWALGHIHKPGFLSASAPHVVYAGSPQGLNAKETGQHGFFHVEVDAARNAIPRFVPACEVLWLNETIKATWQTEDAAIEALEAFLAKVAHQSEGRSVLLRLEITGRTALHSWLNQEETQRDLLQRLREQGSGSPFIWTDRLDVNTRSEIDLEARRRSEDITGEILRQADALCESSEGHDEVSTQLNALLRHARAQSYLKELDEEQLKDIIQRAAVLAVDRLGEEEES